MPRRLTTPCSGRRSRLRRDLEWPGEGCAAAAADGERWADEPTAGLLGVILVTPHPSWVLGSKALASRVLKHSAGRGQVAWATVGAGSARGCFSAASATHSGWPPVLRGRIGKGQRVHGQSFRRSGPGLLVPGAERVGSGGDAASARINKVGYGGLSSGSVQRSWSAPRARGLDGGQQAFSASGTVTVGGEAARAAWGPVDGAAQQALPGDGGRHALTKSASAFARRA